MRRWSFALLGLLLWCSLAQAEARVPAPGYFRYPAIGRDVIVFTAEGDLWRVPLRGGDATRLTTQAGEESHAAISPDGTRVAFSASFEGPTEVYVLQFDGTAPRRLTFEGDTALVAGWTPTGEILYTTRRHSQLPGMHLARLDPATTTVTLLPLALASGGSFDATGRTVFFTRFPFQGSFTKRYQGGGAQSIWRYVDGAPEAEPLTAGYPGTSRSPMAWDGRVYFVSDRDGAMNLWSMDESGADLRQLTRHVGFDVHAPSLAHGRIAYQHGADLRMFDIVSGRDVLVPVRLSEPLTQMHERQLTSPADWVSSVHLSPSGDRVVITARGQVVVAPARGGRVTAAARQPGVRYRDARFLPDGKSLLALADSTGELEFWRIPVGGQGTSVQLTHDASVVRKDGLPSPDGLRLASQDQDLRLWIHDIATGEDLHVASSRHGAFRDLRWSPDGKWLAYVQPGENAVSRIWIYGIDDGIARVVTTDRFDSDSPTWGLDGAWLYFLSDRTFESTVASPWGARQPEPFFDRQTSVYELALRPGARSRFATAEERSTPLREAIGSMDDGIDFDGLPSRLAEVPLVPGNYSHLETDGERLYFLAWDAAPAPRKRLAMMPMDDRRRLETVASGVLRYELSSDRSRLLLETAEHFHVVDADGTIPDDLSRTRLKLDDWSMTVLPREEWRQIFVDAWRLQRDGFYDRNMHGVDWQAIRQRYEPLLARVTDRAELSDLIAQMVGELSALHMFVRGADERKPDEQVVASLGATVTRDADGGGYRVVDVLRGDPDRPEERSPLAAPHADVRAGDVIMAIDGVSTLAAPDISVLLRGGVGRSVRLRVRTAGSGFVRDVTVRPVSMRREADLRYAAWETDRRQQVDEASSRQIGYLHLRGMTAADMAEWQRAFYPVHRRPGLIIDLRRNTGGNIDSWLLSRLLRQAWFFWQPRVGQASPNMPSAYRGHVAVLVDQETASDGEALAEGVKRLGLGVVIGTRTWGGELWGSGGTALLDRGTAAVPETGVFSADGTWLIEGHGVEPDIIVDNLPRATFDGDDAQLDAAVTYLTRRIREAPVPAVAPPPYPDKRAPADTVTRTHD